MFTDLVGSTALSTKLDPEDMRPVIEAYNKSVAEDGLRELIWARYGMQLLDERRAKLQPLANSLLEPRRRKKSLHQVNAWLTSGERRASDAANDDLPF